MTDKEKFRKEVEKLKSNLIHGACASQIAMETRCKEEAYNEVLAILDSSQEKPDYCCGECAKWVNGKGCSREKQNTHCITDAACEEGVRRGSKQKKPKFKVLDYIKPIDSSLGSPRTIVDVCDSWYVTDQGTLDFEYEDNWEAVEEPVSEELEKIVEEIAEPTILNAYGTKELARRLRNTICGTSVSEGLEEASKNYALNNTPWDDCKDEIQESFKAGAKWEKAKNESITNDLGEYLNELSKQFPEVSFAKLSRIAVRVAKWQKENLWKHADGDDLPEIDREVIAIVDYDFGHYKVVYAHRPNPNGWNGTNIDTGEKEHFEPVIYDKGGWNQPHVLYWLDTRLPYEENKITK